MKLIKVVKIDLPGYRVLSGEVAGLLQTACKPVNRTRVFGRTAFTQNGHPQRRCSRRSQPCSCPSYASARVTELRVASSNQALSLQVCREYPRWPS